MSRFDRLSRTTTLVSFLAGPLLGLLPACSFKPHIPDGALTCSTNQDCPEGLSCNLEIGRCCRAGACAQASSPDPAGVGTDAQGGQTSNDGSPAPGVAGDAAIPDSEPAVPAMAVPGTTLDAGAADGHAGPGDSGSAALAVSCSGVTPVPVPEVGRQTFCTIVARDVDVALSIHSMVPGDPVSVRTYGVCYASLPLGRETADATTSVGRPLSAATLQALVDVTGQFKKTCAEHKARLVGATAGQWARQASNRPEIQDKFRAGTGLDLDVSTPAEEFSRLYHGVTRNRRGRAVIMETTFGPEIITWPRAAPALIRQPLPLSFAAVNTMFFGATYPNFQEARRALRSRLGHDLEPQLAALRVAVADKSLEPGFLVGPAEATIPLAINGQLRDGKGAWNSASQFEKKRDEAAVTPSPYGRIFGPAPISPVQINSFFATLDDAQWKQLRDDPIRSAYGGEVLYVTTLLDLLADETKATEFAFVFANSHLGYLFAKLLPPPI